MRVIDRFGPYGLALAPGVTVQESDQPAITDDRLAQRPFQRLIRLVRRSTTVPFSGGIDPPRGAGSLTLVRASSRVSFGIGFCYLLPPLCSHDGSGQFVCESIRRHVSEGRDVISDFTE